MRYCEAGLLSAYRGLKLRPDVVSSDPSLCLLSAYRGLKQFKGKEFRVVGYTFIKCL